MKHSRRTFLSMAARSGGLIVLNVCASKPEPLWIRARALHEKRKVPAVVISLIGQGQVFETKAFGLRETQNRLLAENETVFEAASLSKPAYAYCVFQLIREGKLKSDEPLLPYVDGVFSDDPRLAKVTARMVLAHTSGLPHAVPDGQAVELQFEPGAKFSYSATGFDLLQRAIAKITGQAIDEFMRQRLFRPLGMANSEFIWTERLSGNLAAGYDANGKRGETFIERFRKFSPERRAAVQKIHPEISYPPAAAGLYTTAPDYAKFLLKMIAPEFDEMCARQVKVTDKISWGMGWGLLQEKRGPWIWHWGNWNGLFQHFVALNRARKEGIVILTNSGNGLRFCQDFAPEAIALDIRSLRIFFE